MTHRILRAMFASGLFDHPTTVTSINASADAAVAQETAEQGSVLLKNDGTLPLNASTVKSIAVIGSHADIGVLSGGGSAQVTPVGGPALVEGQPCPPCWARVVWIPSPPLAAIKKVATGATVTYNDGTNRTAAAALAASSDVAIVFVSQWESEGMDVPSLNFTDVIHASPIDQDALVFAVAAANPHTIVVMENGGPQLTPWINNVSAILEAWYPGQKGGDAIANILFGSVNPSGKLPMTFPASVSDLPRPTIATPPDSTTPFVVDYNIDGLNVGYKWYERKGITPLFPFGFGLSYTTFAITNAQLLYGGLGAPAGFFQVKFDLQNIGTRAGAEVVQIYLGLPAALGESKRLVGWQKATLTTGQKQSFTVVVDPHDSSRPVSYWEPATKSWTVASGTYTVFVGTSSANATSIGTFHVP
jgi:beta-glucosidase